MKDILLSGEVVGATMLILTSGVVGAIAWLIKDRVVTRDIINNYERVTEKLSTNEADVKQAKTDVSESQKEITEQGWHIRNIEKEFKEFKKETSDTLKDHGNKLERILIRVKNGH
jgi:septal ring factor EnvC (AmiA/AmiB activator)